MLPPSCAPIISPWPVGKSLAQFSLARWEQATGRHHACTRRRLFGRSRLRWCWCLALLLGAALLAGDPPPILSTGDGATMVLVPAGPFVMGSHQGAFEESPPHEVFLPAYYIDRMEVTVSQYAQFIKATGHPAPAGWVEHQPPAGSEQLPITNIRWTDAMRYAQWAGKRLPTEAEWEKAARGPQGRLFPWGNADDPSRRHLDGGKLRPVGGLPSGASPYGVLDLSGNAWEWTADWFLPYPGTTVRLAHFGQHDKVIRGGAGEYLYATLNTGTTTQRARLVPYGAHDFVGFRCVQDPAGQMPPYDPEAIVREAEAQWDVTLRAPRVLTHEIRFAQLKAGGKIPLRIEGLAGQAELVVAGFPLPRGRLREPGQIRILNAQGTALPQAPDALAFWPDGTLRWVLLRFPAQAGDTVWVDVTSEVPLSAAVPVQPLVLNTNSMPVQLSTGRLDVELDRESLIRQVGLGGRPVCLNLQMPLTLKTGEADRLLVPGPAESLRVTSQSLLHADVRWRGRFQDQAGQSAPLTYDLRLRATAGSARLRLWLTVLHDQPRRPPWEEPIPQVAVGNWRLGFRLPQPASEVRMGGCDQPLRLSEGFTVELVQTNDLSFTVRADSQAVGSGTRAPGWVSLVGSDGAVTLGLRHFWPNHPKALRAESEALWMDLWAGGEPFLWEGGLAKTHEFILDFSDSSPSELVMSPLRVVSPSDWTCGTEAAGALLPRNDEALRQFAYWECWRQDAMRRWVNAMPTGLRDFGDGYLGGPYKGKNAYANLEYDVPMNFLHQFLRTGDTWYLDAAEVMVRHQGDIDTENVAGFAWKHSPLHTTTQAEFGHVFLRGLLLHHVLTGDPRDREVAEQVGDWIAQALLRGQGVGNERQIGWSLYALTALYELTRKPLYLEGAQALCQRLIREQDSTGKFNIRWDNRIAFFNGIAMSGMLGVNDLAPDPAMEQGLLRLANRTLGMYPEYACRTLNAWCWVVQQNGDPRFLHHMERTWVSSLEFLLDRDCSTAETHAWRFPVFAARYNLFPQFKDDPGPLPAAASWNSLRLKSPQVDLYLQPRSSRPVPLLLVREGLALGTAELADPAGRPLQELSFHAADRLMESAALQLPPSSSWHRLRLVSPEAYAWQVHFDSRMALVVADPQGNLLPHLLPRAFGQLREGIEQVTLQLEATGEGFHAATLYDPHGNPVRRVQHFIDFEDPGRYHMTLVAPVSGPRQGWSLELNAVKVLSLEGFQPYWSADPNDLFNPEQSVVPSRNSPPFSE